jgi:hypothetical protein
MEYLFSHSIATGDGCEEIPGNLVDRWNRQMRTEYIDLSEKEKESDRKEADKFLALLREEGVL